MDICLLTTVETARFEGRNHDTPDHDEHFHISFEEALEGIRNDLLRAVDTDKRGLPPAVTAQLSNNCVWKIRRSGYVTTKQLVRVVQG